MSAVAPTGRRRLSPRAAIGAAALLCLALVAAYWTLLRADFAVLSTGLRPAEAAAVVADLDAKGVPHQLRDDGTTVLVPADQADDLRLSIAGSDLPLKGAVGFELFNKSDMGLTDFAQKINYQRALQGELARTIMMIDGIESARVHLALPERSLFRQGEGRAKAAIEIIARAGRTLAPERVDGIRQLVAAAVPELPADEVVVLDGEGRVAGGTAADTGARSPEMDERTAAQGYYAARARTVLAERLPGQRLTVRALAMPFPAGAPDGARRDFALRLTLVSPSALGMDEQRLAREAVIAAVGLDEAAGDGLVFEVGRPVGTSSYRAPALPMALSASPEESSERPQVGRWVVTGIGLLLIGAILVLLRRRRTSVAYRGPKNVEESFADRLRARLDRAGAVDGGI